MSDQKREFRATDERSRRTSLPQEDAIRSERRVADRDAYQRSNPGFRSPRRSRSPRQSRSPRPLRSRSPSPPSRSRNPPPPSQIPRSPYSVGKGAAQGSDSFRSRRISDGKGDSHHVDERQVPDKQPDGSFQISNPTGPSGRAGLQPRPLANKSAADMGARQAAQTLDEHTAIQTRPLTGRAPKFVSECHPPWQHQPAQQLPRLSDSQATSSTAAHRYCPQQPPPTHITQLHGDAHSGSTKPQPAPLSAHMLPVGARNDRSGEPLTAAQQLPQQLAPLPQWPPLQLCTEPGSEPVQQVQAPSPSSANPQGHGSSPASKGTRPRPSRWDQAPLTSQPKPRLQQEQVNLQALQPPCQDQSNQVQRLDQAGEAAVAGTAGLHHSAESARPFAAACSVQAAASVPEASVPMTVPVVGLPSAETDTAVTARPQGTSGAKAHIDVTKKFGRGVGTRGSHGSLQIPKSPPQTTNFAGVDAQGSAIEVEAPAVPSGAAPGSGSKSSPVGDGPPVPATGATASLPGTSAAAKPPVEVDAAATAAAVETSTAVVEVPRNAVQDAHPATAAPTPEAAAHTTANDGTGEEASLASDKDLPTSTRTAPVTDVPAGADGLDPRDGPSSVPAGEEGAAVAIEDAAARASKGHGAMPGTSGPADNAPALGQHTDVGPQPETQPAAQAAPRAPLEPVLEVMGAAAPVEGTQPNREEVPATQEAAGLAGEPQASMEPRLDPPNALAGPMLQGGEHMAAGVDAAHGLVARVTTTSGDQVVDGGIAGGIAEERAQVQCSGVALLGSSGAADGAHVGGMDQGPSEHGVGSGGEGAAHEADAATAVSDGDVGIPVLDLRLDALVPVDLTAGSPNLPDAPATDLDAPTGREVDCPTAADAAAQADIADGIIDHGDEPQQGMHEAPPQQLPQADNQQEPALPGELEERPLVTVPSAGQPQQPPQDLQQQTLQAGMAVAGQEHAHLQPRDDSQALTLHLEAADREAAGGAIQHGIALTGSGSGQQPGAVLCEPAGPSNNYGRAAGGVGQHAGGVGMDADEPGTAEQRVGSQQEADEDLIPIADIAAARRSSGGGAGDGAEKGDSDAAAGRSAAEERPQQGRQSKPGSPDGARGRRRGDPCLAGLSLSDLSKTGYAQGTRRSSAAGRSAHGVTGADARAVQADRPPLPPPLPTAPPVGNAQGAQRRGGRSNVSSPTASADAAAAATGLDPGRGNGGSKRLRLSDSGAAATSAAGGAARTGPPMRYRSGGGVEAQAAAAPEARAPGGVSPEAASLGRDGTLASRLRSRGAVLSERASPPGEPRTTHAGTAPAKAGGSAAAAAVAAVVGGGGSAPTGRGELGSAAWRRNSQPASELVSSQSPSSEVRLKKIGKDVRIPMDVLARVKKSKKQEITMKVYLDGIHDGTHKISLGKDGRRFYLSQSSPLWVAYDKWCSWGTDESQALLMHLSTTNPASSERPQDTGTRTRSVSAPPRSLQQRRQPRQEAPVTAAEEVERQPQRQQQGPRQLAEKAGGEDAAEANAAVRRMPTMVSGMASTANAMGPGDTAAGRYEGGGDGGAGGARDAAAGQEAAHAEAAAAGGAPDVAARRQRGTAGPESSTGGGGAAALLPLQASGVLPPGHPPMPGQPAQMRLPNQPPPPLALLPPPQQQLPGERCRGVSPDVLAEVLAASAELAQSCRLSSGEPEQAPGLGQASAQEAARTLDREPQDVSPGVQQGQPHATRQEGAAAGALQRTEQQQQPQRQEEGQQPQRQGGVELAVALQALASPFGSPPDEALGAAAAAAELPVAQELPPSGEGQVDAAVGPQGASGTGQVPAETPDTGVAAAAAAGAAANPVPAIAAAPEEAPGRPAAAVAATGTGKRGSAMASGSDGTPARQRRKVNPASPAAAALVTGDGGAGTSSQPQPHPQLQPQLPRLPEPTVQAMSSGNANHEAAAFSDACAATRAPLDGPDDGGREVRPEQVNMPPSELVEMLQRGVMASRGYAADAPASNLPTERQTDAPSGDPRLQRLPAPATPESAAAAAAAPPSLLPQLPSQDHASQPGHMQPPYLLPLHAAHPAGFMLFPGPPLTQAEREEQRLHVLTLLDGLRNVVNDPATPGPAMCGTLMALSNALYMATNLRDAAVQLQQASGMARLPAAGAQPPFPTQPAATASSADAGVPALPPPAPPGPPAAAAEAVVEGLPALAPAPAAQSVALLPAPPPSQQSAAAHTAVAHRALAVLPPEAAAAATAAGSAPPGETSGMAAAAAVAPASVLHGSSDAAQQPSALAAGDAAGQPPGPRYIPLAAPMQLEQAERGGQQQEPQQQEQQQQRQCVVQLPTQQQQRPVSSLPLAGTQATSAAPGLPPALAGRVGVAGNMAQCPRLVRHGSQSPVGEMRINLPEGIPNRPPAAALAEDGRAKREQQQQQQQREQAAEPTRRTSTRAAATKAQENYRKALNIAHSVAAGTQEQHQQQQGPQQERIGPPPPPQQQHVEAPTARCAARAHRKREGGPGSLSGSPEPSPGFAAPTAAALRGSRSPPPPPAAVAARRHSEGGMAAGARNVSGKLAAAAHAHGAQPPAKRARHSIASAQAGPSADGAAATAAGRASKQSRPLAAPPDVRRKGHVSGWEQQLGHVEETAVVDEEEASRSFFRNGHWYPKFKLPGSRPSDEQLYRLDGKPWEPPSLPLYYGMREGIEPGLQLFTLKDHNRIFEPKEKPGGGRSSADAPTPGEVAARAAELSVTGTCHVCGGTFLVASCEWCGQATVCESCYQQHHSRDYTYKELIHKCASCRGCCCCDRKVCGGVKHRPRVRRLRTTLELRKEFAEHALRYATRSSPGSDGGGSSNPAAAASNLNGPTIGRTSNVAGSAAAAGAGTASSAAAAAAGGTAAAAAGVLSLRDYLEMEAAELRAVAAAGGREADVLLVDMDNSQALCDFCATSMAGMHRYCKQCKKDFCLECCSLARSQARGGAASAAVTISTFAATAAAAAGRGGAAGGFAGRGRAGPGGGGGGRGAPCPILECGRPTQLRTHLSKSFMGVLQKAVLRYGSTADPSSSSLGYWDPHLVVMSYAKLSPEVFGGPEAAARAAGSAREAREQLLQRREQAEAAAAGAGVAEEEEEDLIVAAGIPRYVPGTPLPPGYVAAWGRYVLPAEDVRLGWEGDELERPPLPEHALTLQSASQDQAAGPSSSLAPVPLPLASSHPRHTRHIFTPHYDSLQPSSPRFVPYCLLAQQRLARSEPLVVRECRGSSPEIWQPENFRDAVRRGLAGSKGGAGDGGGSSSSPGSDSGGGGGLDELYDCADSFRKVEDISEERFFELYAQPYDPDRQPHMLKLKDYPRKKHFRAVLPQHYEDFVCQLPLPWLTRPDEAPLNLATCLPPWANQTDLGPKAYIAFGTPEEWEGSEERDSVTKLHIDMSDALNLMNHVQPHPQQRGQQQQRAVRRGNEPPQKPGYGGAGAVWDIYSPGDTDNLRSYMRSHAAEFVHQGEQLEAGRIHDPVLDQTFYLNRTHRERLWRDHRVTSWHFEQYEHEAVFIPAGCAHQVRNLTSCIKTAIDFVSPQAVRESLRMVAALRRLPRDPQHCDYDALADDRSDKLQGLLVLFGAVVEHYRTRHPGDFVAARKPAEPPNPTAAAAAAAEASARRPRGPTRGGGGGGAGGRPRNSSRGGRARMKQDEDGGGESEEEEEESSEAEEEGVVMRDGVQEARRQSTSSSRGTGRKRTAATVVDRGAGGRGGRAVGAGAAAVAGRGGGGLGRGGGEASGRRGRRVVHLQEDDEEE
ncbi:hypothetical protein Agub_g5936 [Astrephomene gubernaculifera]|uniref:JmjC domain-containing protein n=1 Tax=Astrephomene gubernaculifera TaxID=47775 RepID=A0AAD3HL14_9CHLO|nr:hypothetical protein Agub_g5936 [Astrephomene gubernaculifera]